MRRIRYQEIAVELRELAAARGAGSLLPSESELSARFGASRVTVRRALEVVRDDGLIDARQGFGWFVATEPVRQRLEHLGTIEDQLEDGGRLAERRVTEFAFVAPPERVAECSASDQVLRVKRLNLADGEPFAVVTVWCPAALGRTLSREDVEQRPFYELLGVSLRGATQTIGADSPNGQTPSCSTCRSARPCCAASGSPPTPTATRSSSASTCTRPTAPSSSSSSPPPSPAPPPPASASSADHPSVEGHPSVGGAISRPPTLH